MAENRLLVIDDEPGIIRIIKLVAEGVGYSTIATDDATIFLGRVADWKPTHVMLDLLMPAMSGVELLGQLSAQTYAGKIVISSGGDAEVLDTVRQQARQHGLEISAILLKPFRASELKDLLEELLLPD